jgi:hypothetical protein
LWPQFGEVTVSWHGQFAYVSGAYLSDRIAWFSQSPLRINGRTHWLTGPQSEPDTNPMALTWQNQLKIS